MALVGALTGLLIAVVIGGGWWLWQQRGDDGTPATATSETPAPEETPEDDTSPDAEVEPTEETTTADAYECWDGSTAEDASSCGEPTGTEGLMWVFPDLATDSSCFQRPSDDLSVGAIDSWECPVDDYDTGYVRYTWWRSINEMFGPHGLATTPKATAAAIGLCGTAAALRSVRMTCRPPTATIRSRSRSSRRPRRLAAGFWREPRCAQPRTSSAERDDGCGQSGW